MDIGGGRCVCTYISMATRDIFTKLKGRSGVNKGDGEVVTVMEVTVMVMTVVMMVVTRWQ